MQAPSKKRTAKRPCVLVLGSDSRMVLPIARSLGRQDIDVHLAWCPDDEPVRRSRYVRKIHELQLDDQHPARCINGLERLLEGHDYQLVIPATEPPVFLLQSHREQLKSHTPVYLINPRAFATCFDKRKTYALAESLDIAVPRSVYVSETAEPAAADAGIELPAIVKPGSSVRCGPTLTKNFVLKVDNSRQLQQYVEHLAHHGCGAIVQEFFPGVGVGVELLADRGDILFAFQHERLHETTGHGSTYRKSVPLDQDLLAAAAKLVKALDYTGVAMVEFRVDRARAAWRLMEINARFWGSLSLAVAAGADFPHYLYQLLVNGQRHFPQEYRTGVYGRSLTEDLVWWWKTLGGQRPVMDLDDEGALGWSVNQVSRWRRAGHLLRGLAWLDHIDMFAWDDSGPWRCELTQLAKKTFKPLLPKVPAEAASSFGRRFHGCRRGDQSR